MMYLEIIASVIFAILVFEHMFLNMPISNFLINLSLIYSSLFFLTLAFNK